MLSKVVKNKKTLSVMLGAFFCLLCIGSACDPKEKKEESEDKVDPMEARLANGHKTYIRYCLACHQQDGSGVPGMYPPIRNTDWVTEDEVRLIGIVINGYSGPMEVNGQTYNNAMPQHSFLSDQEIADLLTYLRQNFENDAEPIDADLVAAVREETKQ